MLPSVVRRGRPRDRALGCLIIPSPRHVPCLAREMGSGCGQGARRRIQAAPRDRDGRWGARQWLSSPAPVPSRPPQVSRKPRSPLGTAKPWRNRLGETPCSQAPGPGLARAPPAPQLPAQTAPTPPAAAGDARTSRGPCHSARSPGSSVAPEAGEWVEVPGCLWLWCALGSATPDSRAGHLP